MPLPEERIGLCDCCGAEVEEMVPIPRSLVNKKWNPEGSGHPTIAYWACVLCVETGMARFPRWDFPVWTKGWRSWLNRDVAMMRATCYVGNRILAELRKSRIQS